MCLIVFALNAHANYRLILAANRDESYERPTAAAAFWEDMPHLLGGRDLRAGGTWLGMTRTGRIAAITNSRVRISPKENPPSRGILVRDFLLSSKSPQEFIWHLSKDADQYNGFNLIVGAMDQLFWYSNRGKGLQHLQPGIYGLSNHLLDTPWPKVVRAKDGLSSIISKGENLPIDDIFRLLGDRFVPDDQNLPDTGIGIEKERMLAPLFIVSPDYGTRSSTLVLVDKNNRVTFIEKTCGTVKNAQETVSYEFQIEKE